MKINGKRYNRLLAGDLYELGQKRPLEKRRKSAKPIRARLNMAIRQNDWLSDYYSE